MAQIGVRPRVTIFALTVVLSALEGTNVLFPRQETQT